MSGLNASSVLVAWEHARLQAPVQRALTLLCMAWPQRSIDEWAAISIGERDAALLTQHEQLFATAFENVAECPRCAQTLEVAFRADDIRAEPPPAHEALTLCRDGYQIRFRLPNSGDLLAIMDADSGGHAALLERCVHSACRGSDSDSVSLEHLPEPVRQALSEEMARADPQADVTIAMSCPACGHRFRMPFDILDYLWSELEDWAQRALYEVHVLASAYGWYERDILEMSPQRRQIYLEMSGG